MSSKRKFQFATGEKLPPARNKRDESTGDSKKSRSTENCLSDKLQIKDFARRINPEITVDNEVEEMILSMADYFVERTLSGAAEIAKAKGNSMISNQDLNLCLTMNCPGIIGQNLEKSIGVQAFENVKRKRRLY